MDFGFDDRTQELHDALTDFMTECVYPAEPVFAAEVAEADDPWSRPPIIAELKEKAQARGLWNLFLPHPEYGAGLTNLQYAPLAELTGRSPHLAPEALNCAAPDTGNMELLAEFGSAEQRETWLMPLLDATIRSAFCMTEPDVASSDATNIATRITRDGDEVVVNGRKWWSSGAMDPMCQLFIVMGKSDPAAERHRQQSMVLVPRDTPGVTVHRGMRVFGYTDGPHGGHAEISFTDVRVPASSLIGGEGDGFAIAQARLGPGRIHHCMRLVGMAERALELMCRRALARKPFGKLLSDQGVTRERIANARILIDQARFLTLNAADRMDKVGNKQAKREIAMIKVAAPNMACQVVDWAMQVHGAAAVSEDTPLAYMYAGARTIRFADGPDEVHRNQIAKMELEQYL